MTITPPPQEPRTRRPRREEDPESPRPALGRGRRPRLDRGLGRGLGIGPGGGLLRRAGPRRTLLDRSPGGGLVPRLTLLGRAAAPRRPWGLRVLLPPWPAGPGLLWRSRDGHVEPPARLRPLGGSSSGGLVPPRGRPSRGLF